MSHSSPRTQRNAESFPLNIPHPKLSTRRFFFPYFFSTSRSERFTLRFTAGSQSVLSTSAGLRPYQIFSKNSYSALRIWLIGRILCFSLIRSNLNNRDRRPLVRCSICGSSHVLIRKRGLRLCLYFSRYSFAGFEK